jgi:hypothetical protein
MSSCLFSAAAGGHAPRRSGFLQHRRHPALGCLGLVVSELS